MLKKLFIAVFFTLTAIGISAQNIAVIDVSEILENMDDYKNAQKEIDKLSEQYRQIVIAEQDKVRAMYNKYEAEVVLMTEDMKNQVLAHKGNTVKVIAENDRQAIKTVKSYLNQPRYKNHAVTGTVVCTHYPAYDVEVYQFTEQ